MGQEDDQKFCVLGSTPQQIFQEGSRMDTNLFYDWWWGYVDMDLVSVRTVSELLGVLILSLFFGSG